MRPIEKGEELTIDYDYDISVCIHKVSLLIDKNDKCIKMILEFYPKMVQGATESVHEEKEKENPYLFCKYVKLAEFKVGRFRVRLNQHWKNKKLK